MAKILVPGFSFRLSFCIGQAVGCLMTIQYPRMHWTANYLHGDVPGYNLILTEHNVKYGKETKFLIKIRIARACTCI